jgi:hypothetical protein
MQPRWRMEDGNPCVEQLLTALPAERINYCSLGPLLSGLYHVNVLTRADTTTNVSVYWGLG